MNESFIRGSTDNVCVIVVDLSSYQDLNEVQIELEMNRLSDAETQSTETKTDIESVAWDNSGFSALSEDQASSTSREDHPSVSNGVINNRALNGGTARPGSPEETSPNTIKSHL